MIYELEDPFKREPKPLKPPVPLPYPRPEEEDTEYEREQMYAKEFVRLWKELKNKRY